MRAPSTAGWEERIDGGSSGESRRHEAKKDRFEVLTDTEDDV